MSSERLLNSLQNDTLRAMIMAYMEVQCLEMWSKVKIEKLQKWPKFGKSHTHTHTHTHKIRVDERISQCLFGCYAF